MSAGTESKNQQVIIRGWRDRFPRSVGQVWHVPLKHDRGKLHEEGYINGVLDLNFVLNVKHGVPFFSSDVKCMTLRKDNTLVPKPIRQKDGMAYGKAYDQAVWMFYLQSLGHYGYFCRYGVHDVIEITEMIMGGYKLPDWRDRSQLEFPLMKRPATNGGTRVHILNADGKENVVADPGGQYGHRGNIGKRKWKNARGEKVTVTKQYQQNYDLMRRGL